VKRLVVAALMLAACNRGNNYVDPAVPDMAEPVDLAPVVDLSSPPGPSCGEIAMCAFGCNQDPTCLASCAMGADPQTLLTLGQLLLCAGQNCISLDPDAGGLGGIDMTQLFTCLFTSCSMEIGECDLLGGF
jgi:hypothetical protein